jgi:MFS transporter (putative signal transducer)
MRFATIALLACQQYLTISLIYAAIPVVLRQNGAPLELIGLFGTVFFAFTINFLWAPMVDRYPLTRLGRRRSWILVTQVLSAGTIAAAALLDPGQDHAAVLVVSVVLATLAATQRIATLGYATEALSDGERSIGAAVVGWGGALGNVIGGALCLYLIDTVGWQPALSALAVAMLGFAVAIIAIAEPRAAAPASAGVPLLRIFRRGDIWRAIIIVAPATFGVAVAFAMIQPRMVDLGFGVANIGVMVAATHVLAFTLVGPVVAPLARGMSPLQAIAAGGVLLAPGFVSLTLLDGLLGSDGSALAAVVFVFCALAVQNIAFTTYFFSLAGSRDAATEVTFLTAAMSALALLGFTASGFIAGTFGYAVTLIIAATGYGVTAVLATWWRPAPAA